MNGDTALQFAGEAHAEIGRGPVSLVLSGQLPAAEGAAERVQLLFCSTTVGELPPRLPEARLIELPPAGPASRRRFRLESGGQVVEFDARAVQRHADAGAAFRAVLPDRRAPLAVRAAWAALLLLMRVPGAARLLARLRGAA